MAHEEIDKVSGVPTTGHEWDGIKELNNPLPRWWLWVFYATIVFAVGYVFVYPAVPLVSTYTKGLLGHSQRASALAETEVYMNGGQRGLQVRLSPQAALKALGAIAAPLVA